MKNTKLQFTLASITIITVISLIIAGSVNEQKHYKSSKHMYINEIQGAVEWLALMRNDRNEGTINFNDILRAKKEIAELSKNNTKEWGGLSWDEIGPNNVGGRTRAICIDKSNSNLIFAGAVSGGLWKTTTGGTSWEFINSFPDMNVSCIAQNPINGYLYVGTGESFANIGDFTGTPGFIGSGLYESTDGGNTWHIYNGAEPSVDNNGTTDWAFVNEIAIDPSTGRVYAATNKGLKYWDGSSWINAIASLSCTSVETGSDRTVIAILNNKLYVSPGGSGNGDEGTYTISYPTSGTFGRIEIAIAPSDPNYAYAVIANTNGSLKGVFRTTNKTVSWDTLALGGAPAFDLFGSNNQGGYDNVVSVNPTNPNQIFVGGICLWEWHNGSNFTQISSGYEVHADIHEIVFNHSNPSTFYVGSDGGISKTTNGGTTFQDINKNYNVTQFYACAISKTGSVMGGTQDNSCPYVNKTNGDPISNTYPGSVLFGGDGGWAAFSAINTEAFFGTMQYAGAWRSPDQGSTYQSATDKHFFSNTMLRNPGEDDASPAGTDPTFAQFVTPLQLWESFNNIYSADSVTYTADADYLAGDTVTVNSNHFNYPFEYVLTAPISEGNSIEVQDIITSNFYIALSSGIWMTQRPLDFSTTPEWYKISTVTDAITMSVSKDGNYLFVGNENGKVYRISNLLAVKDSLTGDINSSYSVIEQKEIGSLGSSRTVTSIGIDPNDASRIVVTLGNYGQTNYVYLSENALDASPTFTTKQGTTTGKKLPAMPVYCAMIEMENPDLVIIGTEYGVYATQDITATSGTIQWTEQNTGMCNVPVFQIRQQIYQYPGCTNYGNVYIGTHGRGFFEVNKTQLGVKEFNDKPILSKPTLQIYPNPVKDYAYIDYSLGIKTKVIINIYDLNGRLAKTIDLSTQSAGKHSTSVNCSDLKQGTYIMQCVTGETSTTAKFMITK